MMIQDWTFYWYEEITELLWGHPQSWVCLQREAQINSGQRADDSLPP